MSDDKSGPYRKNNNHQHNHSTSETLTSEDSVSSFDEIDHDQTSITQRLQIDQNSDYDQAEINRMVAMAMRHGSNNASMSSMGLETDIDSEFDRSENVFGLEDDGGGGAAGDESMSSSTTGYGLGKSENGGDSLSTPVMMKKGSQGRFGFLRSGSATPSPRDKGSNG